VDQLLALVVAVPLLAAAAISAFGPLLGHTRRILDAVAIVVAASIAVMLLIIITNSIGAYLSLSGIGLIYGRAGALNMAQIGAYIGRHPPDGLVAVAFLLIISGLLIKSAIVPFQFWLADAQPTCRRSAASWVRLTSTTAPGRTGCPGLLPCSCSAPS
jgi:hypothetical protein